MEYFLQAIRPSVIHYLQALTKESELRATLILAELHEQVEHAEQEQAQEEQIQKEQKRQSQGDGMMRAPFGHCPQCSEPGAFRNKTTGMDTCGKGHIYSSRNAVLRFDKKDDENND